MAVATPAALENAVVSWRSLRAAAAAERAAAEHTERYESVRLRRETARDKKSGLQDERRTLAANTTILTADTDLDEIMLGIKCMFVYLGQRLLREFRDLKLEMDSLIRRVLTLPGEMDVERGGRVLRVRIFRNPKDEEVTKAVERAIRLLNQDPRGPRLAMMDPSKGGIR